MPVRGLFECAENFLEFSADLLSYKNNGEFTIKFWAQNSDKLGNHMAVTDNFPVDKSIYLFKKCFRRMSRQFIL